MSKKKPKLVPVNNIDSCNISLSNKLVKSLIDKNYKYDLSKWYGTIVADNKAEMDRMCDYHKVGFIPYNILVGVDKNKKIRIDLFLR